MTAIGFIIDKAPKGGYRLSRVVKGVVEESLATEVVAYCSTLMEAQSIEHDEKRQIFGEPAWYPAPPPRPAYLPPPPAHSPEHDLPEGLPRVVEDYKANGGMMGELYRSNGVARAMIPALFLASMWAATYLRPLVA